MNIQDALKETGKARKKSNLAEYAFLDKSEDSVRHEIFWFVDGEKESHVQFEDLFNDDWQPYHEEKEIRPDSAGELWRHEQGGTFYTHAKSYNTNSEVATTNHFGAIEDLPRDDKIHNKNGWTRLYPPVEEDVERIEIEGVRWVFSKKAGYQIPQWPISGPDSLYPLLDKPPMKMILEIPKDKP
ncbi:hypothetical protein KAR91_48330 [Candidatus Pacearchaeota archaeon]|nr:hypothetical protein [Candidatus Pacearchaeota archaeon]